MHAAIGQLHMANTIGALIIWQRLSNLRLLSQIFSVLDTAFIRV